MKVKAIGKGTEYDPLRPNLDDIKEIANLHKALDELRQQGKDIKNITLYTIKVISYDEKTQEFEVEINVNKDIANKLPEPVKSAFKELCSVEKSGT